MWCGTVCGSLFLVFAAIWGGVLSQTPHRRFEYKYSFKAPYLAQKDNQVPFWTYSGNAIASSESMRITPSLRSQKGQAWSKLTTTFDWWEVEIVFRINGRGRVGADGLAFWYTTAQGVEGPVFGSSDKWNGLGLFFDSFDNDNKRNNPYVMAMVNDGTKAYDHENDGMSQLLGGCLRDYRNKPHPVRAKIEYFKNTLTVSLQNSNLDILGFPDDDANRSPPLYNLFHHDSSSMGNHHGGEGGFLLNHFPSSRNGSNDGSDGSEGDEGHHDPHTSSFFGSWFADAQELDGAGRAGENYPAGPSANYDEITGDGTDSLYNDSKEVGYEDGEDRQFSDPSMYDGEALETVREEPTSSRYGDPAEDGALTTSPSPLVGDESAKDRWSGWAGSTSSGDEVSATGAIKDDDAAVNVTEKLKRVKMLRKEKRRLQKERRKMARKFRKIGQRKSRILIHNGLTPSDKDYEICTRAENVVLPPNGYFGLSAATGGLADDHDVLKFLVTSLRSADELTTLENNREQEEQFQREFQAYQEKTQKAREEYVAAHPDATPRHGENDDDFEGGETRELRQIFEGQSQIYDVIRQLNAKMDEIIGRQERTLSLVGAVHSGMAAAGGGVPMPPVGAGAPPLPAVGGVISRYEVDSIIGTQRDISQTVKDVKTVVLDINQKTSQILGKPVGSAQPVGGSYDMHVTLKELNEGLNNIKNTLGTQQQRGGGPAVTGSCPSCLSTWLFVGVAVTQLIVILGYMMIRDNKEAQAKKFY